MTARTVRCTAQRIQQLAAEAAGLRAELERLVAAVAPWLLELSGVGPISAAQVLVSWSHAGRLRSEAAFAALAGANPIRRPSKGKSTREIRRCLKRAVARQLSKLLERYDPAQVRPATVV
jgi:transposase